MEFHQDVVALHYEQLHIKSEIKKYLPRIEETILNDKPIKLFVCLRRAKPVIDKETVAGLVQFIFALLKSNFELNVVDINDDTSVCYEYDPQSVTNNIGMIIFPNIYLATKWELYQFVAFVRKRYPDKKDKLSRRIDLSKYLESHVTHDGIILGENDRIDMFLCTNPKDPFQVLDIKKLFIPATVQSSPRRIVVIDVETNDWRPGVQLDVNDNSPLFDRAIQIAWAVFDCNSPQKSITESCYYVTPDRFKVSDKARALHSISTQQLEQEGRTFQEIIMHLKSDIEAAAHEALVMLVSHHLEFDRGIIVREMRLRGCDIDPFGKIAGSVDTFDPEYLRIVKPVEYANRRFGLKLTDSLQIFGAKDLAATTKNDLRAMCHNALADVKMAALIYFGMRQLNLID